MEKKIQKQYVYEGFGFPVVLKNVPMIKVRGRWTPDVNFNDLMTDVLKALAAHESRLTGSEVRFVRHYFEMTQQQLADKAGVTRQTIIAIEAGKYAPSLPLAFRIARTFGLPLEDVFQYQDDEPQSQAPGSNA